MVERHNRRDGTAFLGCTRFPDCRGTRPLAAAGAPGRPAPKLADGGRPKTWADDVELITARMLGRNLNLWQSFALRVVLIVVVFVLFINLIGPVSTWFGQYMADVFVQSMATPTPAPTLTP
jgi:hypothetical protein